MDMVWLRLPATGGAARIPAPAVEDWKARGWVECDPPPEPDLLHDPGVLDDPGPAPDDSGVADVAPDTQSPPKAAPGKKPATGSNSTQEG